MKCVWGWDKGAFLADRWRRRLFLSLSLSCSSQSLSLSALSVADVCSFLPPSYVGKRDPTTTVTPTDQFFLNPDLTPNDFTSKFNLRYIHWRWGGGRVASNWNRYTVVLGRLKNKICACAKCNVCALLAVVGWGYGMSWVISWLSHIERWLRSCVVRNVTGSILFILWVSFQSISIFLFNKNCLH